MADYITLMHTVDMAPTVKRVYLGQSGELLSTPAPFGFLYRAGEVKLSGLADLSRVLTAVSENPAYFAVRGKIREDANRESMRRAHKHDPTLDAAPHHWVLLDLDKWRLEVPAQDFANDPGKYAAEAREALPKCFRQAGCWWQATGSAGIKPGVRLRLAFWLDRQVDDTQLKRWAGSFDVPIDTALFTPSQPHFTGTPIFEEGLADPVRGSRCGVLPGGDVTVPDLTDVKRAFGAEDDLAAHAKRVRKTPEGERRNTLNRTAYTLAAKWSEEELSSGRIVDVLFEAATAGGFGDGKANETLHLAVADGREKGRKEKDGWRGLLAKDKEGENIRSTAANVSVFLEHHPVFRGKLAYDERAQRPLWLEEPPWGGSAPRPVTEADETYALEWFQTQAWIDAKPNWARSGFLKSAQLRSFDPIQDYLARLPAWDGQSRVDSFFIRHLGVEDTALMRAQTACWFIQAVRRANATVQKPVQADYLIVLSGEQGLRKSSLLRALVPLPRFFRDDLPDITTKDARAAVADSWIVELSELTHRKADRDSFKAFVTARVDKFRPPYGRNEVEIARRSVLVGSTNEHEFLTDPTGNRRFWPMKCTRRASIEEATAERDQLWAEAVARAERGEQAYLSAELEAEARDEQERYREEDAAESELEIALRQPVGATPFDCKLPQDSLEGRKIVRIRAVHACTLVTMDGKNPYQLARVKACLRRLGWIERRIRVGNYQERFWYPPVGWVYRVDSSREATN